jgi:hypothetical protein
VNIAASGIATPRYHFLTIVAFTLLALGLMRAVLLVAHQPVLGYGDQADMHRTADCVGLQASGDARGSGELPRPAEEYYFGGVNWAGCYPGSAVVLAVPVALAYGVAFLAGDDADIIVPVRAFGLFNLALFAALALLVAHALRNYPVTSLVHAALFFLIIADPVSTLWLNSFHTEPAALLGAYGAVAMAAVIVLTGGTRSLHWWVLGASLACLGLAREQFGYLPLALAALMSPALLRISRRKAWTLLALGAGIAVVQIALGPMRPDYISPMNRVNVYLGVILATSGDEEGTLEELGLPWRCAAMAGSTWKEQRGEKLETACPEAAKLSSLAFLKLLPTEPLTLMRVVSRILPAAESIVPGYLGVASEGRIRGISDLPPRVMSFIALLSSMPAMVYATVVMTMLISFPLAIAWLIWTVRNEPIALAALPVVFVSLIAIAGYSLATTAFGDGIVGADRHNWLGSLAMLAALALLPLVIWQLSRDLLGGRIALAATLGAVLLGAGWLLWTRDQPMAIGAMDRVAEGPGRALEVGGWALDPWGVRRVYVSVGGGPRTEATRGIERRDLEAIYPGYPEAVSGGFQISIPHNAWRENESMRIYVENRAGGVTEIDRRVIRLRP